MEDAKLSVSVLVAVKNEELNIRKCLSSLMPAAEVVLVDSGSTDGTVKIAESEFKSRVIQYQYGGGYPKKRQWALDNFEFVGEWILLIDADEVVPKRLWAEIDSVISSNDSKDAYFICKGFHFLGKRFRFGGFSHDAIVLLKKGSGRFEELVESNSNELDMEVHERVIVDGSVGKLRTHLIHEDFKDLEAYIQRHNRYSSWEAKLRRSYFETSTYGRKSVSSKLMGDSQERRRFLKKLVVRIPFESSVWFFYHYILRLGFLEGYRGYLACKLRAQYIFQVRAKLFELKRIPKL